MPADVSRVRNAAREAANAHRRWQRCCCQTKRNPAREQALAHDVERYMIELSRQIKAHRHVPDHLVTSAIVSGMGNNREALEFFADLGA